MDDLISRQAAIDVINKNRDSVFHDSVHYEDAVYDISNLPSAQPEPRWIPWEKLERYAEFFCADVSYTEFVREAKQFCLDAERSEE